MPTYQYRCTACSNELEAFQKFSDPSLTVCPTCEGTLRKVFNPVGIVFKGSGFYATDSRSKGKAASMPDSSTKQKSAEPASTSSAASSANESKPSGESKPSAESKPSNESRPASGSKPVRGASTTTLTSRKTEAAPAA